MLDGVVDKDVELRAALPLICLVGGVAVGWCLDSLRIRGGVASLERTPAVTRCPTPERSKQDPRIDTADGGDYGK